MQQGPPPHHPNPSKTKPAKTNKNKKVSVWCHPAPKAELSLYGIDKMPPETRAAQGCLKGFTKSFGDVSSCLNKTHAPNHHNLYYNQQVLQQGPPHVLSECTTYAPVVEEIGQMWGPNHVGDLVNSAGEGRDRTGAGGGEEMAVDPALSLLIGRFATMIVQKVRPVASGIACPSRGGEGGACLLNVGGGVA